MYERDSSHVKNESWQAFLYRIIDRAHRKIYHVSRKLPIVDESPAAVYVEERYKTSLIHTKIKNTFQRSKIVMISHTWYTIFLASMCIPSGQIYAMEGQPLTKKSKPTALQHVRPILNGSRVILTAEDVRRITSFGDVICRGSDKPLREFTTLDLSNNELSSLPLGFETLTALDHLSLSGNLALKELFQEKWRFPKLAFLDISHTAVGKKNPTWYGLRGLEILVANNAQFTHLDGSVAALEERLTSANFSHNRLQDIHPVIYSFKKLIYLNFSHNMINEISVMISQLRLLQGLHLDGNKFAKLPDQIGCLPELRELSLRGNQLKVLPQLEGLKNLRVLRLDGNHFSSFPHQVCALSALEDLSLNSNTIATLNVDDVEPPLHGLQALTLLSLCDNKIQILPKTIGLLIALRKLALSHNMLTELPIELCKLKQLKELFIDGNEIVEIPACIAKMALVKLVKQK